MAKQNRFRKWEYEKSSCIWQSHKIYRIDSWQIERDLWSIARFQLILIDLMNCVPLSFSSISNFETMDMNVVRTTNNKLYEHDTHRIDGKRKQEKVFFFFVAMTFNENIFDCVDYKKSVFDVSVSVIFAPPSQLSSSCSSQKSRTNNRPNVMNPTR